MTRTSFRPAPTIAALALMAAGLASAQPASAPAAASSTDRRFVQDAGAGGAAEVALGKLATQKSSRDDVKQFGQQMVDDHTKAGAELKQVAGAKGMTPPDAPTPAQQKTADQLARRSGASFDKSFLNQMVLDHEKTIRLFKRESRSGADPDLKAFATKTLPTLEGHLKMVRGLQTKGGPMNRAINEKSAASAPS
jgi:putative membrane protein